MSNKYKFRDQEKLYFVSFSVVYWIDVFIRDEYRDILVDSLKYCIKEKGLELFGWCIMTSHVHLIIGTQGNRMEDILHDLKSHTARELRKAIKGNAGESRKEWMLWLMERAGTKNSNNRGFQFWQQDNHPIELGSNEMLEQKLDYLHNNPVEAGFVLRPEDYRYSSARDYAGERGQLEVRLIH